MPLFDPPREFVKRLRRYDPALRCRWSDSRSCFLVERHLAQGEQLFGGANADADEHQAAADGYVILFEVDRESLDDRVIFTLWSTDIQRLGGADVVNTAIDKRLQDATGKSRAVWMDQVRQEARAAFRYMNRPRTVPEKFAHTAPVGGMSIND